MSTTESFNVYKGLPYQVRVRADGKWDYAEPQIFTTDGQSVNVSMTAYDGLSETYEESYQSADKVDFSNTVLPWKWEYSTALSTNRYCLMPIGTTYENVVKLQWAPSNFTKVGNVNINESKIASNFTSANYLKLGAVFNPSTYGWLMVFRVKTGSDVSSIHCINGSGVLSGADFQGVCVVTLGNNFVYYLSSTGSSWDIANEVHGATTIQPNTWYYVRIAYTGSLYSLSLSDDGINWTTDASTTSSTPIYVSSQPMLIGGSFYNSSNQSPWNGSIDLSQSYIKINGSGWWVPGFTKEPKTVTDYSAVYGSVSISGNIVTMSSYGAYIAKYYTGDYGSPSTLEMVAKFKYINSDYDGCVARFFGTSSGSVSNVKIELKCNSTGVSFLTNSASGGPYKLRNYDNMQANTWYWAKIIVDASGCRGCVSTDGQNWSTPVWSPSDNTPTVAQCLSYKGFSAYCEGNNAYFDISECYVKGDNTYYWQPLKTETETLPGCTYNFTDDGSATTLNCFAVNGDESVVLTPDNSYTNGWLLGTVSIPSHTVYSYNNGVWTEANNE